MQGAVFGSGSASHDVSRLALLRFFLRLGGRVAVQVDVVQELKRRETAGRRSGTLYPGRESPRRSSTKVSGTVSVQDRVMNVAGKVSGEVSARVRTGPARSVLGEEHGHCGRATSASG